MGGRCSSQDWAAFNWYSGSIRPAEMAPAVLQTRLHEDELAKVMERLDDPFTNEFTVDPWPPATPKPSYADRLDRIERKLDRLLAEQDRRDYDRLTREFDAKLAKRGK